ncbi:hypothetical protein K2173_016166 [Erythroxylum novogranatense]|uniref:Cytochrome P450 n=1 Tax=Erythroxylum novogranatense TaxID=1862640 RepID=A0AAV8SFM2_9ROSI|nr:hypothetical protein K2173_016166 [Erythroxylum novogranatense]
MIMFVLPIIMLGTCLFLHFRRDFKKLIGEDSYKLPPGPRGLPIVGYLPFLGHNLHRLFMKLAQTYGPIYKLWIGQKLCVIISSPALAKEIVRDQDVTFSNRNPNIASRVFSFDGKDIAFAPLGPRWRQLRTILVREMQSEASFDASYLLRRNEVKKSVAIIYGNVGHATDIGELAFTTVVNIIAGMFWGNVDGRQVAGIDIGTEFRAAAGRLVQNLGRPNVSDFFPILARFDIQGVQKDMKKVMQQVDKIYDIVIDQRIKRGNMGQDEVNDDGKKNLLQFLLEFREHDTGEPISHEQIKALLMDIVIGGTDTTSTTVEWAMAEMMLHPEVMVKAQLELTEVVGLDNEVEETHVKNLPYLHAVVKETLRLHPVAPLLLPRSPTKSCNVSGYAIPKDTKVFLNVWAMHRDPEFWESPLEFKPDRFLGDKLDYLGQHLHYLPFGSGRRVCAGLRLGERMVMYLLATLVHMFLWESPDGTMPDTSEKLGVVLEKSNPLLLVPTPRLGSSKFYV